MTWVSGKKCDLNQSTVTDYGMLYIGREECKNVCDSREYCLHADNYVVESFGYWSNKCTMYSDCAEIDSLNSHVYHKNQNEDTQTVHQDWIQGKKCSEDASANRLIAFTSKERCKELCDGDEECEYAVFGSGPVGTSCMLYTNCNEIVDSSDNGNDTIDFDIYHKIDCSGTWSACDADCSRSWTETVTKSEYGAECPAMPACAAGEDECPAADIDCSGTWSECDANCSRSWTETVAQSGNGAGCPTMPACTAGEDECPAEKSINIALIIGLSAGGIVLLLLCAIIMLRTRRR